jgi:uncharacterized delta-60 repeat protein
LCQKLLVYLFPAGDAMNTQLLRFVLLCAVLVFPACRDASAASLDPAFGEGGRVAVNVGTYGDKANAVVAQPDGRILVGGSTSNTVDLDFMLFRLLPDGSLDPAFNYDGTVSTAVGSFDDEILTLALQDDGKIIAAGYSSNEGNRDFALVRYNSDGSLDRNFALEGMVVTEVGSSDDEITDVAIQPDGGIVLTGSALGADGRVVVLARYLTDGTPDPAFADEGFSLSVVGRDAQAESVVLTDDGRIIVSGSYSDEKRTGLMLVGFDTNGQIDREFGHDGIGIPADSSVFSEGYGMFIRDDGGMLLAGSVGKAGERDAALFLFTEDGLPDSGFAANGALVTAIGTNDDMFYDVLITGEVLAATGVKIAEDGGSEAVFVTYTTSLDTGSESQTDTAGDADQLVAEIVTTEADNNEDSALALTVVSPNSVVVVGTSGVQDVASAEVSKYTFTVSIPESYRSSTSGNQYILTGQPYDVTRTTAVIPVEIRDDLAKLGTVTKRGIVFDTAPHPVLKDGESSDGGDNSDAPVMSNLSPSGTVSTTSVTLTLTTDVDATCKYTASDSDSEMDYSAMVDFFDATGGRSHSRAIFDIKDETAYTYYVRCESSTGVANTTDGVISFTVQANNSTDDIASSKNNFIETSLQTVGNLFVSTAIAQDTTTDTTTTTATTTDDSSDDEDFFEEGNTSEGAGIGEFSATLENLKPGTFFYARAYAVRDGIAYYGNQVTFRTADSCFVATAAFGSLFHPSVKILRDFRDQFMLNNPLTRSLVHLYYRCSPPVADVISSNGILRPVTRVLLLPVVGAAWLTMRLGWLWLLLVAAAMIMFSWYGMPSARKGNQGESI